MTLHAWDLTAAELQRFRERIGAASGPYGCEEWTRARMGGTHPYGQIRIRGKLLYAHRLSFELHHGPIPPRLRVLHRCDNPPCCTDEHIFAGTAKDNTQDMIQKFRARYVAHLGEANGFAKLTEDQIRQIFAMRAAGTRQVAIASAMGCTQANISLILKGDAWRHVDARIAGEKEATAALYATALAVLERSDG